MGLVFSPLSEEVMGLPPSGLYPKCAFLMRQLGAPPAIDVQMSKIVQEVLSARGYSTKDANSSTGSKDFLERILNLIRGTGFTVAVFSNETRQTAMANICLELGFAAMCGKPLLIVKSKDAAAPSDLTRTDWIVFDETNEDHFRSKINKAINTLEELAEYQEMLLDLALDAASMDCAVAFERALKAFLLNADVRLIAKAESIKSRIDKSAALDEVDDLKRLSGEVFLFIRQARKFATTHKKALVKK